MKNFTLSHSLVNISGAIRAAFAPDHCLCDPEAWPEICDYCLTKKPEPHPEAGDDFDPMDAEVDAAMDAEMFPPEPKQGYDPGLNAMDPLGMGGEEEVVPGRFIRHMPQCPFLTVGDLLSHGLAESPFEI